MNLWDIWNEITTLDYQNRLWELEIEHARQGDQGNVPVTMSAPRGECDGHCHQGNQ